VVRDFNNLSNVLEKKKEKSFSSPKRWRS